MMYHVKPMQGDRKGTTIFESENWNFAKQAADNYKRDTSLNCAVESVSVVYVTQTLDEALAQDARTPRTLADRTRDHKAAGFTPGNMAHVPEDATEVPGHE